MDENHQSDLALPDITEAEAEQENGNQVRLHVFCTFAVGKSIQTHSKGNFSHGTGCHNAWAHLLPCV